MQNLEKAATVGPLPKSNNTASSALLFLRRYGDHSAECIFDLNQRSYLKKKLQDQLFNFKTNLILFGLDNNRGAGESNRESLSSFIIFFTCNNRNIYVFYLCFQSFGVLFKRRFVLKELETQEYSVEYCSCYLEKNYSKLCIKLYLCSVSGYHCYRLCN